MTYKIIRDDLLNCVDEYKRGVKDREYVENRVNYYVDKYAYSKGAEIIDMLNEIDGGNIIDTKKESTEEKKEDAEEIKASFNGILTAPWYLTNHGIKYKKHSFKFSDIVSVSNSHTPKNSAQNGTAIIKIKNGKNYVLAYSYDERDEALRAIHIIESKCGTMSEEMMIAEDKRIERSQKIVVFM